LRHGKEIWYTVFPLECAAHLHQEGTWTGECPLQPIYIVAAVIAVQNCYLSKNSVRIPRNLKTPVRFFSLYNERTIV
jgi:hypothetical protein